MIDIAVPEAADLAAAVSAVKGIRQGLEDFAKGRAEPARAVFNALRTEYRIPRRSRQSSRG